MLLSASKGGDWIIRYESLLQIFTIKKIFSVMLPYVMCTKVVKQFEPIVKIFQYQIWCKCVLLLVLILKKCIGRIRNVVYSKMNKFVVF